MPLADYYLLAFRRFADFGGRSTRSEFWYFWLSHILAMMFLSSVTALIGLPFIYLIHMLVGIIPSFALTVRRLHDVGLSGLWFLIGFVPVVGTILLLIWYCTESDPGTNAWGPHPLAWEDEDAYEYSIEEDQFV